jgi:hypothetical protein
MGEMEKPERILPPLKSTPPEQPLSPHISLLLERTNLGISSQTIIELADTIQKDLLQGYKLLIDLDKGIGGVGLYNVNKQEGDRVTGAYRGEFRGLFRPIQYVYASLGEDDLVWNARYIVLNSCLHVEKAVKYRFKIPEYNGSSLGILLWRKPAVRSTLDEPFFEILSGLNDTIYKKNKHTIEHIKIDAHDYSPADAIAVYLICRCAGVQLLEPTGLFNYWKRD